MPEFWWLAVIAVLLVVAAGLYWRPSRLVSREARFAQARRHFHLRREWLEARFIRRASQRATSTLVHWADCEFDNDVAYVRNRSNGELSAFVELSVPVEDSYSTSSEGVPATTRRIGTAIFRFDRHGWETEGRAILNLNPTEAIRYYHEDLEIVDQELAQS